MVAKKKQQGDNWIADAVGAHPGAFSKKAENAGKSTAEYAADVLKPGSKASTKTRKQAQLAVTLSKMHKPKGKKGK